MDFRNASNMPRPIMFVCEEEKTGHRSKSILTSASTTTTESAGQRIYMKRNSETPGCASIPPLLLKLFAALPTKAIMCTSTEMSPANDPFHRPPMHIGANFSFFGNYHLKARILHLTIPGSWCSATSERQACSPSKPASISLEPAPAPLVRLR